LGITYSGGNTIPAAPKVVLPFWEASGTGNDVFYTVPAGTKARLHAIHLFVSFQVFGALGYATCYVVINAAGGAYYPAKIFLWRDGSDHLSVKLKGFVELLEGETLELFYDNNASGNSWYSTTCEVEEMPI